MTCNLQVIFHDNELIPTKKPITVDEPVSLGPLRSETQSHSSSLRPPFSSNLTTCSFQEREWGFLFVLSFLLLSFTLTLIFLQKLFIPSHRSHTLVYSLLLYISFAFYGSDGTIIFIMLRGLRKYEKHQIFVTNEYIILI